MQTYNDLVVPAKIGTTKIISAFDNVIDFDKVLQYADIMSTLMLSHEFPPIMGYPILIDDSYIDTKEFINGYPIDESFRGQLAWCVTDGHHRTLAAIQAHLPFIEVKLDYTTITTEIDLKNYDS